MNETPLHDDHVRRGAKLIDFGGWHMPLHFTSQLAEHHAVRREAGLFDVSHMAITDLAGGGTRAFLRGLLANDVGRLGQAGMALYSCMLREDGGILDDLIVYRLGPDDYRIVSNAATRAKDLAWIRARAPDHAVVLRERADLGLLALQGPTALRVIAAALPGIAAQCQALKAFGCCEADGCFIARTGYTGEDGFEIALPAKRIEAVWNALIGGGAVPCGLGARDTLRLEAGLNLYGQDMDEGVTPWECGLSWTVDLRDVRSFVGRAALERQRADGIARQRVGLVLDGPGVIRAGYPLTTSSGAGIITSGSYSPTLERSIALARVPTGAHGSAEVSIRGRARRALLVRPPFVRNGRSTLAPETL